MSWDNECVKYCSICCIYISLWSLMNNVPFHYIEDIFFLVVTQQFEVGIVVFLVANHSSVLRLESVLSDTIVLCS